MTPMLALQHVTELVKDNVNPPVYIQDRRAHQLMILKLKGGEPSTNKKAQRYQTFSEAHKQNLLWKGIKVEGTGNAPKRLIWVGSKEPITAENYWQMVESNVAFRDAIYKSNRTEYGPAVDAVSIKTNILNKVSRNVFSRKLARAGRKAGKKSLKKQLNKISSGNKASKDIMEAALDKAGREIVDKTTNEIVEELNEETATNALKKNFKKVSGKLGKNVLKSALNVFRISDGADHYCTIYNSLRGANLLVKTYKRRNIIRLAIAYLSVSDQLKVDQSYGGTELTEEQLAFMGNNLTQVSNQTGETDLSQMDLTKNRNALDSFGIKYLEENSNQDAEPARVNPYADPQTKESLQRVQVGQSPEVNNFFQQLLSSSPLSNSSYADQFCKFINSPTFIALEFAAGVGIAIITGGIANIGVGAALDIVTGLAGSFGVKIIGNYLADAMVAGATSNLFGADTTGEDLGNVIAAGGTASLNETTMHGGGTVMNKYDYATFKAQERIFLAQRAEMIRYNRSPFDITTRHTFLGSIISQILPYSAKITTFGGQLATITQLAKTSFFNLLPGSQALADTKRQRLDSYYMDMCQDNDIQQLGSDIATDPFCNVMIGTSTTALAIDNPEYGALKVLKHLAKDINKPFKRKKQINDNGIIPSIRRNGKVKYDKDIRAKHIKEFRFDCVNRDGTPLGIPDKDKKDEERKNVTQGNGEVCSLNYSPETIYYSLYFLDERVQCNLDQGQNCHNETTAQAYTAQASGGANSSGGSAGPGNYGGATLSKAVSSWGGHKNGQIPLSALTLVGRQSANDLNYKAYLHPDAAAGFKALNAAFRQKFGSSIHITAAYRSLARQRYLKRTKGRLAAAPGTSNHGWGLAADLGSGINRFGSAQHRWMQANAGKYGWCHPPWARRNGRLPEPWHWEYCRPVK